MATARRRYRTLAATFAASFDGELIRHYAPFDEEFGRDSVTALVLAWPDRLRMERRGPGGELELLVVLDGWRRCVYSAGSGAEIGEQRRDDVRWALGAAAELVDPVPLLGALELRSLRRDRIGDREVVRALGEPRFPLPESLGTTDEEELVVDAERGVVLELVGLLRGAPARTLELRDVRFDVEPGPDTFAFPVPPAEEVSGLGLRDVAERASFPVWSLPVPVQQITYRGAKRGRQESVTIEYVGSMVVQTPLDASAWLILGETREVERGGRQYLVGGNGVRFALGETAIALTAEAADDERLLDLAESLVRVEP